MKKVVCGMSGGVDSSVAAILLKQQGYKITGVFMRNWDITDEKGFCQADYDKEDAEYVCRKIGIPFFEVNFVKEYWNNVFNSFVNDYKRGYTPNPDILCNKNIKFDAFFKYVTQRFQVDGIATGHYARVCPYSKGYKLLKGKDILKDQTFFLSQIPKNALEKCIFPLGELTKNEVKNIALSAGLSRIVEKKESMGICFVGRRNFQSFIDNYIEPKRGFFINIENNKIVGQHKGIHCWTVGQRCAIPGNHNAYYVVEKNANTQDIMVAPGQLHPALLCQTIVTESPYWINEPSVNFENGGTFQCDFRFQHRKPLIKCLLFQNNNGELQIFLEKPLRALTPGQYAVFYTNDECLGSARIVYCGPSLYSLNCIQNKT